MEVLLHEQSIELDAGTTLHQLRQRVKPDADIVILNGAIVGDDRALSEGDSVHLIRRGETPSAASGGRLSLLAALG